MCVYHIPIGIPIYPLEEYKRDYLLLYVDTVRAVVAEEDPARPFLVSSPSNGLASEMEVLLHSTHYITHYTLHYRATLPVTPTAACTATPTTTTTERTTGTGGCTPAPGPCAGDLVTSGRNVAWCQVRLRVRVPVLAWLGAGGRRVRGRGLEPGLCLGRAPPASPRRQHGAGLADQTQHGPGPGQHGIHLFNFFSISQTHENIDTLLYFYSFLHLAPDTSPCMTPTAPLSPALSQQLSLTSAQPRPSLAHVHIVHWQHQPFGLVCQLLPKQTFLHWIFCQHLNIYVGDCSC